MAHRVGIMFQVTCGLLLLTWARPAAGFEDSVPQGDPDKIARQAIADATRTADTCLAMNKADLERCKAEMKAAASAGERKSIALRYIRVVSRRCLDAARTIRRIRDRGMLGILDNGGSQTQASAVHIACNKQTKRVNDSGTSTVWEINVAQGMPQTLPGG